MLSSRKFMLILIFALSDGEENEFEKCGNDQYCVPYYQCSQDFLGLIDIRFDETSICSYMETCCPDNFIQPNLIENRIDDHGKKNKFNCGLRNIDGIGFKIVGDTQGETEYGEFPWMIAILERKNEASSNVYICGGALIHPSVVVTAAHCVADKNIKNIVAKAGEWDTGTENEIFPTVEQEIKEIIIHNGFEKVLMYNDIALLITKEPYEVSSDSNINTVCLPPPQMNFDDKECFANGWGQNLYRGDYKNVNILKKIQLPIVRSDICLNILRKTNSFFKFHDSFICGIGGTSNTCKGDGGGPLNCPVPNRKNYFYLSGVVLWGISCEKSDPGLYANIAYLRSWIDFQLTKRGFDHRFYVPQK